MTLAEDVAKDVHKAICESATLVSVRPNLAQLIVPAYADDGDGYDVFFSRSDAPGHLVVTDCGSLLMRLSYVREINKSHRERVRKLAERQGFTLDKGVVSAEVRVEDLAGAVWGLVQIHTAAEAAIRTPSTRVQNAAEFRTNVADALIDSFPEIATRQRAFPQYDKEKLFPVDVFIDLPKAPLAIEVVITEADAERAVATRLRLSGLVRDRQARFVAMMRSGTRLPRQSSSRLDRLYENVQVPGDDLAVAQDRIRVMATA